MLGATGDSCGAVGPAKLVVKLLHSFASMCERSNLRLTSLVLFSASKSGSLNMAFTVAAVGTQSLLYDEFVTVQWYPWHQGF